MNEINSNSFNETNSFTQEEIKENNESDEDEKNNESNENEIFEIENIVDYKIEKNNLFFFIKWKGYNNKKNTLEPIENILQKEVIKKFFIKKGKIKNLNDKEIINKILKKNKIDILD
jgi:hypothetical protein